ncbi:hypothetical protein EJB05_44192, partial [Eragrostis curvula]
MAELKKMSRPASTAPPRLSPTSKTKARSLPTRSARSTRIFSHGRRVIELHIVVDSSLLGNVLTQERSMFMS